MQRGRVLALLATAAFQGIGFVSAPAAESNLAARIGSITTGERDVSLRAEPKVDLFKKSQQGNQNIAEVNGENVRLVDTDNIWGIFFLVVSVLATVFFIQALYSLKPTPSS